MSIHADVEKIKDLLKKEDKKEVKVALFGQPGAGKSSLINKITNANLAKVSPNTDTTIDKAEYEVDGLLLVDLPGYGTKKFPKETYFEKFNINQFDLFLCVTSGALHQADTEFFQDLVEAGKSCIFVSNKHDMLWQDGVELSELEKSIRDDIAKHVGQKVTVIFTSCRNNTGIDVLIDTITNNLDAAKKERWIRSASAHSSEFLEKKRAACEKYVTYAAVASAANGVNPIPGADAAVDVGILVGLFEKIRSSYGLDDDLLAKLKNEQIVKTVAPLASRVIQYAAKEGVLLLLKKFAGRVAVKTFSKYIPVFGQAVAAGLGYAITSNAGSSYLDDCHKLAEEILNNNLKG